MTKIRKSKGSHLGRVARRLLVLSLAVAATTGCATRGPVQSVDMPRELSKAPQAEYVLEPPDLLQIDLISAVPKPDYKIRPLDILLVTVPGALPEAPIAGTFVVDSSGSVNLGERYGAHLVAGKTPEEAREFIQKQLAGALRSPTTFLSLYQTRAVQQIRGAHLIRGDGTVGLGVYGSVSVVGLTLTQAKQVLEDHLRASFQDPEVALDIVGYNSKNFYVVYDFGGAGQQVAKLPLTGAETVLDAISQTQGLPTVSDDKRMWISRPTSETCPQVLPVDWKAITECGDTRTNYQLQNGDRIIVKAHNLVETDVRLARIISPIERLLGVTLLGSSTQLSIRTDPNLLGFGGGAVAR